MKKSSRIAKAVAFKSWSQLPAMPLEDGEFSQVDGKKDQIVSIQDLRANLIHFSFSRNYTMTRQVPT